MDEQDHDKDVVAFVAGNRSVTIGLAVVVAVFGLLWLVIISQVFLDGGDPSTSESTPTTVVSAAALSTAPSASNEITVPTSDIAGAPPTTLSADTTTPIAPAGPSELLVESTVASTFPPVSTEVSAETQGVAAAVSASTMDVIASDVSSSEPASTQPANTSTSSTSSTS